MVDDDMCQQSIEEEARLHRLLGHPLRLKLTLTLRHALDKGRGVFPTKAALVREYQECWKEKVELTHLDFHIRYFQRAGVLSIVPPTRPTSQLRVMLKIEVRRLIDLPLSGVGIYKGYAVEATRDLLDRLS